MREKGRGPSRCLIKGLQLRAGVAGGLKHSDLGLRTRGEPPGPQLPALGPWMARTTARLQDNFPPDFFKVPALSICCGV